MPLDRFIRNEIPFEKKFFAVAKGMNKPPEKIRWGFQDLSL